MIWILISLLIKQQNRNSKSSWKVLYLKCLFCFWDKVSSVYNHRVCPQRHCGCILSPQQRPKKLGGQCQRWMTVLCFQADAGLHLVVLSSSKVTGRLWWYHKRVLVTTHTTSVLHNLHFEGTKWQLHTRRHTLKHKSELNCGNNG